MDFRDFKNIQQKLFHGFLKIFIFFLIVVIVFGYGLIQFILKASEDEKLKQYKIIAMFSMSEFYEPPTQILAYFLQSENMVKLTNKFMDTCKGIAQPPRDFYRLLTLKRILFKRLFRYISVLSMLVHILERTTCSDRDLRFVCGLYVPVWIPIATNYFPVREILQILEILITYRLVMITVHQSIDTYFIAKLFEYKSLELIKLMQRTSLSQQQHLEIVKEKFHDVAVYHQELYECFKLIRDIIAGIIAPGVTVFIPAAACVSVAFMRDFNIAYLQVFLLTIILCYLCVDSIQRITDLGEIIQETAYGMDWYEMDKEMNNEFIIFLMKLQLPLEIKSFWFVMQKPLYLAMLRSIYSFFMMMLQMK